MPRKSLDQLAAAQNDLGTLLATFEMNFRAARLGLFLNGLLFVIGVALLIAGISLPDGIGGRSSVFPIAVGILLFLVSGLVFRRLILGVVHFQVLVFADGFIEVQHNGFICCPWSEIKEVYQEISRWDPYGIDPYGKSAVLVRFFEVHMRDGTELHFREGIEGIEKLGQMIQDSTGRYLLPRNRQAIAEGKTVAFGPVSVSSHGLTRKLTILPWESIEPPVLSEGILRFRQKFAKETWFRVGCHEIPNLYVFFVNVTELLAEERS